jgi:hypothetical protein
LNNSEWKFIRHSTNLDARWSKINKKDSQFVKKVEIELIFENQWGIRVYFASQPVEEIKLAKNWRVNGLDGELIKSDPNFNQFSEFHFVEKNMRTEEMILSIVDKIKN